MRASSRCTLCQQVKTYAIVESAGRQSVQRIASHYIVAERYEVSSDTAVAPQRMHAMYVHVSVYLLIDRPT